MKILNMQKQAFVQNLEKAFQGQGVYQDNFKNRKLGRVGQPYKKENNSEEKENNSEEKKYNDKDTIDKLIYDSILTELKPSQLDSIIAYSNSDGIEGVKIDTEAPARKKARAIAEFYAEAAEGDTENFNSILEDALEDYVPKSNEEENISKKEKKNELSLSDLKGKERKEFAKKALQQAKENNRPYLVGYDDDNQFFIDDAIEYHGGLDKNKVSMTCYPNGTIKMGFIEINEKEAQKYSKYKQPTLRGPRRKK